MFLGRKISVILTENRGRGPAPPSQIHIYKHGPWRRGGMPQATLHAQDQLSTAPAPGSLGFRARSGRGRPPAWKRAVGSSIPRAGAG
eukprot:12917448-Prorocentrum_lima.AAC.1